MKDLLHRIGWSQAWFAQHIGVSERTVYQWCKSDPNPIAMKYLELVARLVLV